MTTRWSTTEDARIRAAAALPNASLASIRAVAPGRTRRAVMQRLRVLGIYLETPKSRAARTDGMWKAAARIREIRDGWPDVVARAAVAPPGGAELYAAPAHNLTEQALEAEIRRGVHVVSIKGGGDAIR